ncbi:MAG: O-antigen polymerase [Thalassobaculum sp.]|uniref:O-antigen polymerase n=1 Tax=Thalassobaculum sp. TaxID=2022740 RepID=UPI0032EB3072
MRTYWWANPGWVTLLLMVPISLIVAAMPKQAYLEFDQARQFFAGTQLLVALAGMLAFAAGSGIVGYVTRSARRQKTGGAPASRILHSHYRRVMLLVGLVAFAGNIAVVLPVLADPGLVIAFLSGKASVFALLKERTLQVPGLTSVSNLAALFAALYALKPKIADRPLDWFDHSFAAMVFFAVMMRAVFNSERLAIIEVVLPIGIIWFGTVGARWRAWLAFAPILGIVGIVTLFAVTEYFRSWTYYRYYYTDYTEFVLSRIWGYYLTALNNGAGLAELYLPTFDGAYTMNWFYRFPLFPWVEADEPTFWEYAFQYATEEFNNTSGIFAPIHDFGAVFGILMWFFLGVLSGRIYDGYVQGKFQYMLIHPTWMIGVYEILRLFYWGSSKYFPTLIVTVAIVVFMVRHREVATAPIVQRSVHPLAPVGGRGDRSRG